MAFPIQGVILRRCRLHRLRLEADLQPLPDGVEDGGQVVHTGISTAGQHAVQALRGFVRQTSQGLEAHRRIDEVAQQKAGRGAIAGPHLFCRWMLKEHMTGSVIVFAADNYIEDDLDHLLAEARMLGIAHGDGYSRRPFVLSVQAFSQYFAKMNSRRKEDLLQYLMESQHDSVDVVATGSPGAGRFENFDCQMPVLPLTTSVRYLAELLEVLF